MVLDSGRISSISLGGGVEGLHLDSADTVSLDLGHSEVTFFTPVSSPGVSNDVEANSVFDTISDSGDGVIEGSSAGSIVKDSTAVHLEWSSVGLDGD